MTVDRELADPALVARVEALEEEVTRRALALLARAQALAVRARAASEIPDTTADAVDEIWEEVARWAESMGIEVPERASGSGASA